MTPLILERTQILPISINEAWTFFSNPHNLAKITPPSMKMRVTSAQSDKAHPGMIISYSMRPLFGIRMNWTSEITHMEQPNFFVDEQRFGPYRFWHHLHRFREVDEGTEIYDLVHYLLPHMQFTGMVNRLIVAPRLKRIFTYRQKALQELFNP